ncbi:tumor necrosis factor receptor superfamily member 9a [Anarrhichthys ocellatus]|uniref:tumor necrosis factor receptor superfamily member 9a n=1 Tax=Anarrhichthys ocellatus TaxID=433405 RepID=UPI0012EE81F9|nr:tumor necrosis factor receptor superfamily member 9-like [Anarrhichthys ocellatus]
MAAILQAMGLSLLLQGCLCSVGQTNRGCLSWTPKGENVCCEACHPGHHLVSDCGPRPKDLCTPCEPGKFAENPKNKWCTRCTQCVGAQVYVKQCTPTTDTQCGCKEGLTCGNARCTFCVQKCDKGQEPTDKRLCRPCPDGTFNDQSHQMCKPWSTRCPDPEQMIVAKGDALTDIKCANVSVSTLINPKKPDPTEQAWPLVIYVVTSVVLTAFGIIIISISSLMAKNIIQKRNKERKKPTKETLIIRPPTDEPRTLIAIECSFHEAQQEQGSSSESLVSKDSSEQLIA